MASPVLAAGCLLWRRDEKGRLLVLIVHRGARADTSLPKGKLDPGESFASAAVREIDEETGYRIHLGAPLGETEYINGDSRPKLVKYWAAEVTDKTLAAGTFVANEEIAAIEWLSLKKARAALSYERDRIILDRFAELVDAGHERTFAIIALRHAKALSANAWDGPDATRPLLQHGLDQAQAIVSELAAFGPRAVLSSTATRCLATVQPVASALRLPIKTSEKLSQDWYEAGNTALGRIVAKRMSQRLTAIICSHGPVLPELMRELAQRSGGVPGGELRHAALLGTGEFTVVHLAADDPSTPIIAWETHAAAL